ncbi:DUF6808 domain-containing protein [uncultured Duncaniella sp.]|uniref:DUF6808 domain-containing protein n=1 Tax=uncultured Duncaniella sp. TaxID=2768039 RepID=UPI00259A1C6B|nr:hypothetical protein [uncultured Duncaniella sp.]
MKENLKLLLVVAAGLIAGAMLHKCQSPPGNIPDFTECVTDTTIVYDTIPYIEPTPQSELALGTRTYTLPKYYFIGVGAGGEPRQWSAPDSLCVDTLITSTYYGTGAGGEPRCSNDSAIVELPIIQRHYADSTYEAWVSGPIDPRLDSVRVFIPTTLITKREWKPPKRWHIGPTIGYGYTPQGLQPYIGVSITYSIISF